MGDDATAEDADPGSADSDAAEDDVWVRETAPQSPYTMKQVGIGLGVLAVGAAIAFGVPLLLS